MASPGLDRIVAQARVLFYERGFDATSMQDLADALGLHKSTLYHHVASKDDVLLAVCRATLDSLQASLDAAETRPDLTAAERLVEAFEGASAAAMDDVLGTNVVISQRHTTETGRTINEWRRDYDRRFTKLVKDAQASGEVRGDIDPDLVTRVMLGAINWVVTWYRPDQERFDRNEVRRAINEMVAGGLFRAS